MPEPAAAIWMVDPRKNQALTAGTTRWITDLIAALRRRSRTGSVKPGLPTKQGCEARHSPPSRIGYTGGKAGRRRSNNVTPGGLDMRIIETFTRAHGAKISGRKEGSSWTFFIAAALAIVLIACALGRVTFQSGSDAWKPLAETPGAGK
jgi:hypothetical protein